MVERRRLDAEFLDSVTPPKEGERWIADTAVRGFGLRLWSGKKGGGVAFCVRVTDKNGVPIRETYDPYDKRVGVRGWEDLFSELRWENPNFEWDRGIPLKVFLEDARRWARWVIGQAKGTLPSAEAETAARRIDEERIKAKKLRLERMPIGSVIELIIKHGRARGWSDAYHDRVLNISAKIPKHFLSIAMGDLTRDDVRRIIVDPSISPGNVGTLRQLLGAALWRVHEMGGPAIRDRYPSYDREPLVRSPDEQNYFLSELTAADFKPLFDILEDNTTKWKQALCLRLSFELRGPMSRIVSGRWDHIFEDRWYPVLPDEANRGWYRWDRIDPIACDLLVRVSELGSDIPGSRTYWFPNPKSKAAHIRNVDRVWYQTLDQMGWPRLSLRATREHYLNMNLFKFSPFSRNYDRQRKYIAARLSKNRKTKPLKH